MLEENENKKEKEKSKILEKDESDIFRYGIKIPTLSLSEEPNIINDETQYYDKITNYKSQKLKPNKQERESQKEYLKSQKEKEEKELNTIKEKQKKNLEFYNEKKKENNKDYREEQINSRKDLIEAEHDLQKKYQNLYK